MKNNQSVTAVKHGFRGHFNIHRNQSVLTEKTTVRWINALHGQGRLLDRRPFETQRTVYKPKNVEIIRQAKLQSSNRSSRKHSIKFGIGNRSVRCILHEDLHFHHNKLIVVQQLKPGDYAQRLNFAGQIKAILIWPYFVNEYWSSFYSQWHGESTELSLLDSWKFKRAACKTTAWPKGDSLVCYW